MDKTDIKQVNLKFKKKGGENMIKNILGAVAVAAAFVFAAGSAHAGIQGTKHDFSEDSGNTIKASAETRMCVFCHTPHNAVESVPLWNRSGPGGTFLMYTASATLTAETKSSTISNLNISYKCLSCHDGTVGVGDGVSTNGGGPIAMSGADEITGNAKVGPDLTNDHPIGFDYSSVAIGAASADPYIKAMTDATPRGVKFYNAGSGTSNMMECASCHDVHNNAAPGTKFLRTSNTGSYLCLSCHDK